MSEAASLSAVTFSSFITSLASSAMVNLGEAPVPGASQRTVDLDLARYSIDALAMLQDKTAGNLDDEEAALLGSLVDELRAKFVEVSRRGR